VTRIGVLASGRGSNFQSIAREIDAGRIDGRIEVLISDKRDAPALDRARSMGIEALWIDPAGYGSREEFDGALVRELKERGVSLVLLAGFMRIITATLIREYRNRIMNIHPALLPAFPGLDGQKQARDYGTKISGCTVHFVDEGMDTGPIVVQAAVPAYFQDTEKTLSERILALEHRIYPEAVRLYCAGRLRVEGRRVAVEGGEQPTGESLISHRDPV